MSHQPERKEKDCLNCTATVHGRFCHICGQENTELKQSVGSLTQHFVYDIFHFDGKFFETLKNLFLRPGIVARQFVLGKRKSYLDPIRMYLFTSAVFFLIFFSTGKLNIQIDKEWEGRLSRIQRMDVAYDLNRHLPKRTDSLFYKEALALLVDSSYRISLNSTDSTTQDSLIKFRGKTYKLKAYRDTLWVIDTGSKNDGFIKQKFKRLNQKFREDEKTALTQLLTTFLHRLPYMLFISLPFFALILKLLYIRRREYFYSDHFIFTLYHYIFSFILLLVIFGFAGLQDWSGWDIFGWIAGLLGLFWVFYLYKGLRNFYRQSRFKTITKFILLNALATFVIFILFLIFIFITAYQIQ